MAIEHIEDPAEYTCPLCSSKPMMLCMVGSSKATGYHESRIHVAKALSKLKINVVNAVRIPLSMFSDDSFIKEVIWFSCLNDVESFRDNTDDDIAKMFQIGIKPKTIESFIDWMISDGQKLIDETTNDIINHFKTLN